MTDLVFLPSLEVALPQTSHQARCARHDRTTYSPAAARGSHSRHPCMLTHLRPGLGRRGAQYGHAAGADGVRSVIGLQFVSPTLGLSAPHGRERRQ
jgi:hypothetical protein